MNILVLGSGGREHALAWKITQSEKVDRLFIAPGNAGTAGCGENVDIKADDFEALKDYIIAGHPISGKVKFFLGYSGWMEGQLNQEISQNSWVVSRASNRSILLANGEDFWKQSLESLGSQYEPWTKYPKDPYWN